MNVDKYSDPGKDNDWNWFIQAKDVDKLRMVISTSIRRTSSESHRQMQIQISRGIHKLGRPKTTEASKQNAI